MFWQVQRIHRCYHHKHNKLLEPCSHLAISDTPSQLSARYIIRILWRLGQSTLTTLLILSCLRFQEPAVGFLIFRPGQTATHSLLAVLRHTLARA